MTIRAFIAVDPSEEVIRRLAEIIRVLERKTTGFRWVRAEAIHLTLRFLGEIEETLIGEIDSRLGQLVREHGPISLSAAGLRFFPGPEKPRVVWAGLEGETALLAALQKGVHRWMEDLHVHREQDREFTPHLTLARIPNFRGASGISAILQTASQAHFGEFVVDRLFLYKSRLTPEGASYTKLREYKLRVNEA